jgi:hypothetical protein
MPPSSKQAPLRRCRYRSVCTELRRLLRLGGVSKSAILACPTTAAPAALCNSFAANARSLYYSLPGEHADEVLSFLGKVLGQKEPLLLPEFYNTNRSYDFRCPELQLKMYQPCRLKQCPFQIPNPALGNCLMNYLTEQERSSLNFKELTALLKEPTGVLRSRINTGLRKLRVGALHDQIRQRRETGLFHRIPNMTTICAVCERQIDSDSGITRTHRRYCSQTCYDYKPPQILALEDEYGLPIDRLLRLCSASFGSISKISPLLHLTQSSLPALFARYGITCPPQN